MAQLKSSMVQSKVQQNVVGKITVTAQQLQDYYNQHKSQFQQAATVDARHVLVKTKAQAEQVRSLLAAKNTDANWKAVAKKYSIDTGTKATGGELGSFPRGPHGQALRECRLRPQGRTRSRSRCTHSTAGTSSRSRRRPRPASRPSPRPRPPSSRRCFPRSSRPCGQAFLKQALKDAGVAYAAGYNPDSLTASPSPAASAPASPSPSATQ